MKDTIEIAMLIGFPLPELTTNDPKERVSLHTPSSSINSKSYRKKFHSISRKPSVKELLNFNLSLKSSYLLCQE